MPAHPARHDDRLIRLLAESRTRLVEAAAMRSEIAETLFVARDAVARSRALRDLAAATRDEPLPNDRSGSERPEAAQR